ncbi:hypothetical protein ACFSBZ_15410 [Amnibacterium flavum]|uniref:hypothetical protein n=1 Tax=Amnibacterium flavum TaxID=2173173 RepID=UPI0010577E17|nr:hypothetical protein [Amnibacterium flavum]
MQSEPSIIRPSLRAYFGRALTAPPITYVVIILLIAALVLSGVIGSVVFWTAAAASLAAEIARLATSVSRERIEVGGDEFRVRERGGAWRSFTAGEVAEAVVVPLRRRGAPPSRLYLRSASGERLLGMTEAFWRGSDLAALADDLRARGVEVVVLDDMAALRRDHGWALERWEARARWLLPVVALVLAGALVAERLLS